MLAKQNPEMESMIYLPYADWLSANDKFDEAQEAYKKAGRPDLSLRIIEFLTQNAITEKRFQDAAQYYWLLSTESLRLVQSFDKKMTKEDRKHAHNFEEYMLLAEIYQAYNLIQKFVEDSHRGSTTSNTTITEATFNAARFISNSIGNRKPQGINQVFIYYTLSKQAYQFEAYKAARFGYEKLNSLKIPEAWQEEIEIDAMKIKTKPNSDQQGF